MGGNIDDGKALVIKTHFIYKEIFHQNDPGMLNSMKQHPSMVEFGRAIILMRHPRESIIAESNRHFTDDPKGFSDKSWDGKYWVRSQDLDWGGVPAGQLFLSARGPCGPNIIVCEPLGRKSWQDSPR